MLQEVTVLDELQECANILKLYCAWEEDNFLFIQTELADCSLQDVLDKHIIDEQTIWNITLEILVGLKWVHQHNQIHMDVKPSNILMFNNRVVLSDFGLAFSGKNSFTEGDSRYLAPELLLTVSQQMNRLSPPALYPTGIQQQSKVLSSPQHFFSVTIHFAFVFLVTRLSFSSVFFLTPLSLWVFSQRLFLSRHRKNWRLGQPSLPPWTFTLSGQQSSKWPGVFSSRLAGKAGGKSENRSLSENL